MSEHLGSLITGQIVAQAIHDCGELVFVDQARIVSVVLVERRSYVLLDVLLGC